MSREAHAKTAFATHSGLFQLVQVQVSCVGRVLSLLCLCARGTGYRMTRGMRHHMAGSLLYKAVRRPCALTSVSEPRDMVAGRDII